jgi:hypothetical protein
LGRVNEGRRGSNNARVGRSGERVSDGSGSSNIGRQGILPGLGSQVTGSRSQVTGSQGTGSQVTGSQGTGSQVSIPLTEGRSRGRVSDGSRYTTREGSSVVGVRDGRGVGVRDCRGSSGVGVRDGRGFSGQ